MKAFCSVLIAVFCIAFFRSAALHAQQKETLPNERPLFRTDNDNDEDAGEAQERQAFEMRQLIDPATGKVPVNIRQRELNFSAHIPTRESAAAFAKGGAAIQATNWVPRGPFNIGGRTRAIGIDVNNVNVMLAGGVSGGGIWRSTDMGSSWSQTAGSKLTLGATCLAQDRRPGKTNVWYYGTGEELGTQGRPAIDLTGFTGNGIYKSTDDGQTWSVLQSTASSNDLDLVQPFNYVLNIVTDSSNAGEDVVYAAVFGGIERSTDGGQSWNMVLGSYPGGSMFTDVEITSKGVLYAALSTHADFNPDGPAAAVSGIYRSTDGINWTNITPASWPNPTGGISLGIAPSNENVVYALAVTQGGLFGGNPYGSGGNAFWKYTYQSGDGSGSGGIWLDRSVNLPGASAQYPFWTQYGYDMYVKVEPDNQNTVYIGGQYLYKSTDGLATSGALIQINNLSQSGQVMTGLHPDQHALVFFPTSPTVVLVGCDGGLFTADLSIFNPSWTPLNNGYYTTQFYTVALDHGTPGNNIVIGGMQDNGTAFAGTLNETDQWQPLFGGDGAYCAITNGRSEYIVSYEYGNIVEYSVTDNGSENPGSAVYVIPMSPSNGALVTDTALFNAPFILDPNDQTKMYFPTLHRIWRNNNLTTTTSLFGVLTVTSDWDSLASSVTTDTISTVVVSTTPANRLYYGTVNGKLYRIDGASTGQPASVDVSTGKGFPAGAYVGSIAVDPQNADNAIVVFANYHVQSLFYTSNGGTTWAPIGGNLEQNPDGSGDGPSCRWASIVHVQGGVVYLVGTSTGLYSTSYLNGTSTTWYKEGASTIGNAIVDMMDVRQSDGMVAVATHGSGMYSGVISSPDAVSENVMNPNTFTLLGNTPNPFSSSTSIQYSLQQPGAVTLRIYDQLGKEVQTIASGEQAAGMHTVEFDPSSELQGGVYYYRLAQGNSVQTKSMVILK